jgi:GNAT superfamily N-acetyltransferase
MASSQSSTGVVIRPLAQPDLAEADRIIRLAFATFLGLPTGDNARFNDTAMARTRWTADPSAVLAAEDNGKFIGSNFAANWGSFGFFGPLTVDPEYWNRGVAQRLLAPTMEIFHRWDMRHLGLYTFADSPKHIALYRKFGFWPRELVAIMAREVGASPHGPPSDTWLFSKSQPENHARLLAECRELTDSIFEGLDLEREVRAVADQKLGDTILVRDASRLAAFAVCHSGPGTEAGTGVCYVKFAAVRPDFRAEHNFVRLLDAAEAFAKSAGAKKILAGINLARREAFQEMSARGFRTEMQGLAMETGGATSGYNRAGVYILDDWR